MSFATVLGCGSFGDPTSNSYKVAEQKGCVSLTRYLTLCFNWLDLSSSKIVTAFSAVHLQKGHNNIAFGKCHSHIW